MTASADSRTPVPPTVACPGGRAAILAEQIVHDDPDTGTVVLQLLERADGRRFARLGYRRDGRVIRGPVSLPDTAWAKLPRRLR